MRGNRLGGFTMVELMVVVLIVGLLIAISIPAAQMLIDRSHQTGCLNNLRQIGVALQTYAMEHDEQLPDLAAGRSSKFEQIPVLDTVFLPYVSSVEVFQCPGDDRGLFERTGNSYFWNYFPTLQEDGSKNLKIPSMEFTLTQTREHSKIPLVVDKEAFHRGGNHANVLYADGSVRKQ
ncbi:MAG: type II secretion system protein [Verrucomicrobiota bacterium]